MKPSAVLIRHRCPPCSSTQSRSSLRTTYRVEARASRAFAASLPTPLQDLKKKKREEKKQSPSADSTACTLRLCSSFRALNFFARKMPNEVGATRDRLRVQAGWPLV